MNFLGPLWLGYQAVPVRVNEISMATLRCVDGLITQPMLAMARLCHGLACRPFGLLPYVRLRRGEPGFAWRSRAEVEQRQGPT